MHGNYFFIAFVIILGVICPASGSLTKIASGAPVYLGEQDLNIASGLQGCHDIGWWPEGADTSSPPAKTVTIIRTVEDSDIAYKYSIDPAIYAGYTGNWYCLDKKPLRVVFEVLRPELSINFVDANTSADITGTTVPVNTSITYRIDTNLDRALQEKYRPDVTPQDSFYTLSLTDTRGSPLLSLYSGNYGKTGTVIFVFDNKPFISQSPYFWKDGGKWDLQSRNAQGDSVYAPGTYTLSIRQNLNRMNTIYGGLSPENRSGLIESSAAVTFSKPAPGIYSTTAATTEATPLVTMTTGPEITQETVPATAAPEPARTAVPKKTTYAPLPSWIAVVALCLASGCGVMSRK